jgi:hypothetical protein
VNDHVVDGQGASASAEREGISRRGFIAGTAGLTAVALSGVLRGSPAGAAESAGGRVTQPPGILYLSLDGTVVGTLAGFEGGAPHGVVGDDAPADGHYLGHHIDDISFPSASLKIGLGMAPAVYQWIASFMAGETAALEVSVIGTTFDRNMKAQLDMSDVRIVEVTFPTIDATSTQPVFLTVKIQPVTARAKAVTGVLGEKGSNQSLWLAKNFALDITGLDSQHVSQIDSFTVRLVGSDWIGVDLLSFTLPEAFSTAWRGFFNTFVLRLLGRGERDGTLQIMDSTFTNVIATTTFGHMGIVSLDWVPDTAGGRRVKAEMYCEEISFTAPGKTT